MSEPEGGVEVTEAEKLAEKMVREVFQPGEYSLSPHAILLPYAEVILLAQERAEKAEANDVLRSLLMRSHHKLLLHDSPASDALAREILEALATPAEEPKEEW